MFHTFGCKQTVSNMLTTSPAFVHHGDTHGAHPVIVAIDGFKVHGTPFNLFLNGFHHIRSMSHMFGWPYVGFGWKPISCKDNCSPNLDFHNRLDMKERKFPSLSVSNVVQQQKEGQDPEVPIKFLVALCSQGLSTIYCSA